MIDFFLDFIQFNADVPQYEMIIPIVILYLLALWFVISIWVFFDARKRLENTFFALLIAIANLILQFPFLFVYLLVRPSSFEDFDDWIDGGVNVPIVNFTGKEGVVMSFELRINPKRMVSENDAEMKIDVSFDSDDPQKVSAPRVNVAAVQQTNKTVEGDNKKSNTSVLSTVVQSVNGRLRTVKSKWGKMSEDRAKKAEERKREKAQRVAERERQRAEEKRIAEEKRRVEDAKIAEEKKRKESEDKAMQEKKKSEEATIKAKSERGDKTDVVSPGGSSLDAHTTKVNSKKKKKKKKKRK